MKITWFGQACFELTAQDGTVIICDPYHPMVGYAPHAVAADIVTISHEHGDHNWTGWLQGNPEIIRGAGSYSIKGVEILGLPSFHDAAEGAQRGANTVFVFTVDGLRLCHLGDLGHLPGAELLAAIGKPDVLFLPAGGFYTMEPDAAAQVAQIIGARLTIPMHFNTGVKETPLATVDAFAAATGAERFKGCTIEIDRDYKGPRTVVLDYLR